VLRVIRCFFWAERPTPAHAFNSRDLLATQRHEENQFADALALADAIANGREPSQKKAA
jgi:hypothetical protein